MKNHFKCHKAIEKERDQQKLFTNTKAYPVSKNLNRLQKFSKIIRIKARV